MQILFSFSVLLLLISMAAMADPTRPARGASQLSQPGAADVIMQLHLIRWQEHNAHAVINGRVLQVGDEVNGYRLQAIHPDHVQLEQAGVQRQLFLFQKMTHNDE
ncbi:hypothetical protein [Alkalimonas mucilaginosa]|uniref:CdsD C-terminal domain-containing protein n=1 Tax=Alkalimonas mucilaginosa TaxID=3057676 RepID=A0ABU7JJS7_9GAMM|nr:hypothetical protein [Alkalimonas sp. MEB004]MEE2025927.1 hypothetical protein [Alkalimonas sp. MEB004]